jgi:hypothetical protein
MTDKDRLSPISIISIHPPISLSYTQLLPFGCGCAALCRYTSTHVMSPQRKDYKPRSDGECPRTPNPPVKPFEDLTRGGIVAPFAILPEVGVGLGMCVLPSHTSPRGGVLLS